MKKIVFLFFFMVSVSLIFVTCKKEMFVNTASDPNQKDTFISSYYNQSYTYGRQTDFEAEGRQMHLDEIIPADSDE